MGAPVIGITTYAPREDFARFYLPVEYVEAVRRAGALPWLIAPGEPRLAELLGRLDGLVLSGGGDLDPELYGGARHATIYNVSRERDATELELARAAFGAEVVEHYAHFYRSEWEAWERAVTDWERQRYFERI